MRLILCLSAACAFIPFTLPSQSVQATVGINKQLNYQARLLTSTGAVVPDGTYNMEFKIYQDGTGCVSGGSSPCAGTLKWTETRTNADKVTIKNGYFSTQLGSVTAFGTNVDWNQDTLWLSINIGGTGVPSWDGEMTPFRRLSSTPYALNAGMLGGLNADQFLQVAPSAVQVDSGTLDSIFLNKTGTSGNILRLQKNGTNIMLVDNTGAFISQNSTNSTNAFRVINAGGGTVLNVDTTNGRVGIGGNFTPDEALDVVGNLQIGDSATPTKSYRLRTSGGALDFEASGADLYFSTWSGAGFTGTQYNQITFKANGGSMDFQRGFNVASGYKVGMGGNVDPAETLDVNGIVQQTGRSTSNTGGTDNNKWTKLASCTMDAQYEGCIATVTILGGIDGTATNNTQAEVNIRTRQQNALGGVPIVNVQMNGVSKIINKSDIVAVTTQNDVAATVVEVWGRITNQYEAWRFTPIINTENKWAWHSTDGFSAALPAGAQTAAVYGDMYTGALTATGAVQILNAASAVVFDANSVAETFIFGSNATTGKHIGMDYSGDNAVLSIGSTDGNAIYIGQYNGGAAEIAHDADLHIIRNTNSTSAFELLDSGDNALFTMDTVNKRFRIQGTGTSGGGSRIHFGDYDNVFIGENGTSDTDAMLLYGGEGFTMQSHYGTPVSITGQGAATFKTSTNSTTAFRVQNSASTSIFTINTTAGDVTINASAATYTQRLCHNQANGATTNMTLGDCAAAGQADLAEFYATDGTTEPGDIVVPNGGYEVTRSAAQHQANAIGIVSTNPVADGILGNNVTDTSRQPIALAGRVPLKVSLENGPIHSGDMLTPASIPGTAMKASGNVPIVGISLESYSETSSRVSQLVAAEEAERSTAHVSDLPAYTSNPSAWPTSTGKIMAFLRLGMSGGNLSEQGLQQAVFNGGIIAGDTTFNGLVAFNNSVTFSSNATFDHSITLSKDSVGTATIPTGVTSVGIAFENEYTNMPIINTTPKQFVNGAYRITDIDAHGFVIELANPQSTNIDFNWTAFASKDRPL